MSRRRARPTRRLFAFLFGALLLFAVGTNVQAGWVLAIAALLLGVAAAGVLLPFRALVGLDVRRRVPRTATAGEPLFVTLEVTNTSRGARGLVRIGDDFCGRGWALVHWLQPGETRAFETVRRDVRRGVYADGECLLESGAPFGAVKVTEKKLVPSPLVVYPTVYDVPIEVTRGGGGWSAPAAFGDVASVRDYRPGDPLKHIHWRSVARRGALVVREFDRERHAELTVIADVPSDPDVADAIATIACSLALGALRSGEVALAAQRDGSVRGARVRSGEAILDWGARLSPGTISLSEITERLEGVPAVLCVSQSDDRNVASLVALASRTTLTAVVVGNDGAAAARRLRAAGAAAAGIRPTEIESWFANGCPLS